MTIRFFALIAVFALGSGTTQAASRLPVRSDGGMVVSVSEISSEVGVEIMNAGGNAIDAAVAVGFASGVMYLSQARRLKRKLPPRGGWRQTRNTR